VTIVNESPSSDQHIDACADILHAKRIFQAHQAWWLLPFGLAGTGVAFGFLGTSLATVTAAAGLIMMGVVSAAFVLQKITLTSDGIELSVPMLEPRFVKWTEVRKVQYRSAYGLLYVYRRARWLPWGIRVSMYGQESNELASLATARAQAGSEDD